MRRQCELLALSRSSYYYQDAGVSSEDLRMMRLIDEQYMRTPFFGSRQMAAFLTRQLREPVNRKRMQRLMQQMGIEAIYARPRTTQRNAEHRVFPYLLRNLEITRKDRACKTFCVTVAEERYLLVSSGMRPSYMTAK